MEAAAGNVMLAAFREEGADLVVGIGGIGDGHAGHAEPATKRREGCPREP